MLDGTIYEDLMKDGKLFRLGGRGPDFFDCWGICLEVGKRAGINYPEYFTPEKIEQQDIIIRKNRDMDFDKIEKPEPYCIVTFKITPPFVNHSGIVLSDCRHFLHIRSGHSVSVNRLDHKILTKRIDGFYKLRDHGIS